MHPSIFFPGGGGGATPPPPPPPPPGSAPGTKSTQLYISTYLNPNLIRVDLWTAILQRLANIIMYNYLGTLSTEPGAYDKNQLNGGKSDVSNTPKVSKKH